MISISTLFKKSVLVCSFFLQVHFKKSVLVYYIIFFLSVHFKKSRLECYFFSYQHTLKKVYWYIILFFPYRYTLNKVSWNVTFFSYQHTLKKVYWNVIFFPLLAHFYEWCCEPEICLCWFWRSVFVLLVVSRSQLLFMLDLFCC
jgi:hypothetical protein